MADADEIPISAEERAFLDAMNDVPDTTATTTSTATTTAAEESTNGAENDESERDGSSVKEEPEIKQEATEDAQGVQEDATAAESAQNTSEQSATPPTENSAAGNQSSSATVDVPPSSVAVSAGESFEPSEPTTPITQQAPSSNMTPQPTQTAPAQKTGGKRKRLPQDLVGQLEDRIAEDPRGDVDAWLQLLEEHKRKGKFDDARAVYERFFQIFPQAAHQWIDYVKMELNNNEFTRVEQVFSRCLLTVLNVELWSLYLDYIRRRNNLTNDPSGKARSIISQAYEFVLNNIGCDKEAGRIWQDQIAFVKSAPGSVGGSSWMDQQKMDILRRVYQKAVTQPVQGVEAMWREYDGFEHGLNKMTAKKFLQERSPAFMTARGCLVELTNLTRGLRRETLPRLPPAPGYEGDDDWNYQVALWKKWIKWEKDDPVVLAKEDPVALKNRIIYAYKQALMALRFWPEMWFDAAEYCFANDMDSQGMDFLKQGLQANPESPLLTFRYAERLEAITAVEDGETGAVRKGQIVRKPYDDLLNTLYGHYAKMQAREKEEIEKLEEEAASNNAESPESRDDDDDDDDEQEPAAQNAVEKKIHEVKEKHKADMLKLSKIISATWIDLMRAMRRIQGHGRVNEPLGGSRQIFADARKKGRITSSVYAASALIEYHCYRDPAALKIFERGMKLFPEDEDFALEYLKHLVNINDITNARAMFETFVTKVSPSKAQRVYRFFYEYEAHYGDLAQVYKLEKRMAELYPADEKLEQFSTRYAYQSDDPCRFLPIISPAHQTRPKTSFPPPPLPPQGLPIPPPIPPPIPGTFHPPLPPPPPLRIGSPKRSATDDDGFEARARKLPRSDSPVPVLKGAAGRRLNQIKQQQAAAAAARGGGNGDLGRRNVLPPPPPPQQQILQQQQLQQEPALPEAILGLLRILPGAERYNAVKFRPEAMVALVGNVALPGRTEGGGW